MVSVERERGGPAIDKPRSHQRRLTVHKFGGAALADADGICRAVALIRDSSTDLLNAHCASSPHAIVVASAFAGVTDTLLRIARLAGTVSRSCDSGDVEALRRRHLGVVDSLLVGTEATESRSAVNQAFDELETLCTGARSMGTVSARDSDLIVARGERLSARLVAAAMRSNGVDARFVDATELIQTDGSFGHAAPDLARTSVSSRARLLPLLSAGIVPVVPGFIGRGTDGSVVTLGRGGSDLAATVLARALEADDVILWKDVDGLLSADPRIVPGARVIPHLNLRDAIELAHYGVKILHPRSLSPLTASIRLQLRSFSNPEIPGTEISNRAAATPSPVQAIVATMDQTLLSIKGQGLRALPGIAARTLTALHDSGFGAGLISQAATDYAIACTVSSATAGAAVAVLHAALAPEIAGGEISSIDARSGVATIGIVGCGLAHEPGVAARLFGALADAGINVVAAAQGSGSGGSLSVVVDATRAIEAQRAIHDRFQLHKKGGGHVAQRVHADIILLGVGTIGRVLLEQIVACGTAAGTQIRVCGVIDRSGFMFDAHGISDSTLSALCSRKARGEPLASAPGGSAATAADAIGLMCAHALSRPILVDATAAQTTPILDLALTLGCDLVLANKVPIASRDTAVQLQQTAQTHCRQIFFEATVGAGLPVIDTLRKLVQAGDHVTCIEGCPSGTLGYLFAELESGHSFATAVRAAVASGYTEPDPRIDLSGIDVARKALILARLIGFAGDISDVVVESLVPPQMRDIPLDAFLARMDELDGHWSDRVLAARANDTVLRYRAHVTPREVHVGLIAVSATGSLGSLTGTDNQFAFTTSRYRHTPLVITGPGAGSAVTAAGILNDILRIAMQRGASVAPHAALTPR